MTNIDVALILSERLCRGIHHKCGPIRMNFKGTRYIFAAYALTAFFRHRVEQVDDRTIIIGKMLFRAL